MSLNLISSIGFANWLFKKKKPFRFFYCEVRYMPFYEYQCTKCHNQTEVFQKISDKPITKCELCNGKMKKLISPSSFHLKGTGWYVTDYASKSGGYDGKTSGKDSCCSTDTAKDSPKETKAAEAKPSKESSEAPKKKTKTKDE
jgi:putative FmdB family regulatory protein